MISFYKKILNLLNQRERRNLYLLLGMIIVMGILEMVVVASILPFLAVLSNPVIIQKNQYLSLIYNYLKFTNINDFLLFLGVSVFTVVIFGLGFKSITLYALARFTNMRNYSISSRLLKGYLSQPYVWFLNRHSSDLGRKILSEVDLIVATALKPAMHLLAQSVAVTFVVALIVFVEPKVALIAFLVLGGCYTFIYSALRKYLSLIGKDRMAANKERFQIIQEALGGIKEAKVMGLEDIYIRRFRNPAHRFSRHQAVKQLIGELPRHILEAISFGGMLMLVIFLLFKESGTLESVLPLVGLYAVAGVRLLPAIQQIYNGISSIRYAMPALNTLHGDLETTGMLGTNIRNSKRTTQDPIKLIHQLELDDINFTYPNAESFTLQGLNLIIKANTTVGVVGSTGAGKTTVVDLILGLLEPQQGEIRVDGVPLTQVTIANWQQNIGYIPQHIFLTDDSVAANIAFGVPESEIDMAAVERAAQIADIHQFVIDDMPLGYNTLVGERGIRISGGQRQRIGIARALYRDPDVLIMDEATSALDSITEKAVMDAIHNLSSKKTIIIIAHRLTTIKECNTIFMLEHGRLIKNGTYEELLSNSDSFFRIASDQNKSCQNG